MTPPWRIYGLLSEVTCEHGSVCILSVFVKLLKAADSARHCTGSVGPSLTSTATVSAHSMSNSPTKNYNSRLDSDSSRYSHKLFQTRECPLQSTLTQCHMCDSEHVLADLDLHSQYHSLVIIYKYIH